MRQVDVSPRKVTGFQFVVVAGRTGSGDEDLLGGWGGESIRTLRSGKAGEQKRDTG
jgi:hypothetical protein